ncbi:MAG TPA: RNA polymerase sigma factor [Longimicrobiales bacterium]|nr:RNA polymerase sigma factor [Longimicrobiales bacterium]
MSSERTHRAIEAAWRIDAPRIIAAVARMTGDVGTAEDLAQDALVAALRSWPEQGVPDNPGAWLMATAKRRAIDHLRRGRMLERKHEQVAYDIDQQTTSPEASIHEAIDDDVGDDLLRLIFTACHPVLSTEARVALTLRLLGGLTTEEIARAFLAPVPTVAQRIVRAKRTLAEAHVPFEVPRQEERAARLGSVLEVIYLIFNEGYAATAGDAWLRADLCEEALRLARVLAGLAPDESEVHGLVALLELQASRNRARIDTAGEPVLLLEQDRSRWDRLLIQRGLAALERAQQLTDTLGPYTLQAAIAACHARARTPGDTDWERIVALYDALTEITQSPVVALNRAVAVAMAFGPDAGLELIDDIVDEPALRHYHLLPAARADLLHRLGRNVEAVAELRRAAGLAQNERERALLVQRALDWS